MAQKCPKKPKAEEFFEGLKVFDKDGYGVVLSGELRQVLTSLGKEHRAHNYIKRVFHVPWPYPEFSSNSLFHNCFSLVC